MSLDHRHEAGHDKGPVVELARSQTPAYSLLRRKSGLSSEEIERAFADKPTRVVCIDERARVAGSDEPVIGLAGSGVLLTDNQREVFLRNLQKAGIDPTQVEITEHGASCGACGIYCKQNPGKDVATVAKESASHLAEMAGTAKPVTSIGWADGDTYRALGFEVAHHARVIYIDGTGCFAPGKLGFPDGFVLSAKYTEGIDDYANAELGIAAGIAMGDHGLGKEFFEKEGPLLVVLVGDCVELRRRFAPTLAKLAKLPVEVVELPR